MQVHMIRLGGELYRRYIILNVAYEDFILEFDLDLP